MEFIKKRLNDYPLHFHAVKRKPKKYKKDNTRNDPLLLCITHITYAHEYWSNFRRVVHYLLLCLL